MPDTTTCRDVQDADVVIHEFTDPGCPWAYSAEPFRRRINWLYGDRVVWRTVMVGLTVTPEDWEAKGYTPESMAAGMRRIAHDHGMPIDTRRRERLSATVPACRAVIGVVDPYLVALLRGGRYEAMRVAIQTCSPEGPMRNAQHDARRPAHNLGNCPPCRLHSRKQRGDHPRRNWMPKYVLP